MQVRTEISIGMTYSIDFRRKVLEIERKERISFVEIANRFDISRAAVFRWSKRIEAKKGRNKPWTKIDREALERDIEQHPDSYSYERARRLGGSPSGIRDAKKGLGVSYKKNSKSSQSGSRKKIYVLRTS